MPQSLRFEHNHAMLRAEPLTEAVGPVRLIWLHGWGQSREALRPLAESLSNMGESWILDLPGHGEAPVPPEAYTPARYAQLVAAWLATQPVCPTVVVGHSLGFRVAVHMAYQNTGGVMGLVALAGAGVPRPQTPHEKARRRLIKIAIGVARCLKPVLGESLLNLLRQRFGSTDYKNVSADMRPTFLAVVADNVSALCPSINQATLLIYGEADTETPPAVGRVFQSLLPHARLKVLPHQTHNSVVAGGRHVVEPLIRDFVKALEKR